MKIIIKLVIVQQYSISCESKLVKWVSWGEFIGHGGNLEPCQPSIPVHICNLRKVTLLEHLKSYSQATGMPPSHHVFWWCKILNNLAQTQRDAIFIDYYHFCMMILQKNISMQLRLSCYKNQKRCDSRVKIELGKLDLSLG